MPGPTDYAGDVTCRETWDLLAREPRARLIDVRTGAEWTFVGLPDLRAIGQEPVLVEWQGFPGGAPNARFVEEVKERLGAAAADTPLLCLCRSGVRSQAAAAALTAAGFSRAYNITGGFEGPLDEDGHRNARAGWRVDGLPWRQG